MEDHNKKQKSLVESLMAYMMKHHYEDYMNLKYDVLINTSESVIRKNYGPLGEGVFTDVITFFEERETDFSKNSFEIKFVNSFCE